VSRPCSGSSGDPASTIDSVLLHHEIEVVLCVSQPLPSPEKFPWACRSPPKSSRRSTRRCRDGKRGRTPTPAHFGELKLQLVSGGSRGTSEVTPAYKRGVGRHRGAITPFARRPQGSRRGGEIGAGHLTGCHRPPICYSSNIVTCR
jgi:hypothetical protein